MKLLTIVKHNPIVFALACLAVLATVFVSESSYWRSVKALDQLSAVGAARVHSGDTPVALSDNGQEKTDASRTLSRELQEREELTLARGRSEMLHALLMQRLGVAVFSVLSLLALVLYMHQTYAFESQQEQVRRLVQDKRDRLEIEVAQRTAQLTELTHHLQTAREDERSRLARNLHDDLGALLTSAKLDAARIKPRLANAAPEALDLLAHLVSTLNSSVALGRSIIEDLRPSSLGNLGLVATLEILTREFTEQSSIEVSCALEPVALEATAELMVFRLVQEGLTNITKYASASHVWVNLATRDGQVEISVRDDGLGFDTSVPSKSAYGLMGMRFRVKAEGGSLTLESAPGQGTLIRATLPPASSGAA
jgi:signal transduction histidine kinase